MNFKKTSAIFALSCTLFACDFAQNSPESQEKSHEVLLVGWNPLTEDYDYLTCESEVHPTKCVLQTNLGDFPGISEKAQGYLYLNTTLADSTTERLLDSGVVFRWREVLRLK